MTPERWRQVKAVFESVADLPPGPRAERLTASCGDDATLRGEVEDLLAAEDHDDSLLDTSNPGVGRLLAEQMSDRRVGPYRLEREIGRGGMGVVYLAVRDDAQYHRRVAIKLLRRSVDSRATRSRFRRERQILAGLDHPSIARLLDGGTTERGVPYLVMEYVEGLPIDVFCDRRRLSVHERCALVQRVCLAVHAAHQSLVVHRDLKPSNLLITDDGMPKLLDFGVARLLNPELSDYTASATGPGTHPMTLNYASPEQVRGETVTAASDVYALGMLLYTLLTGRRPYQLGGRSRAAAQRLVCEIDPPPPSRQLQRDDPTNGQDEKPAADDRTTADAEANSDTQDDYGSAAERARYRRQTPEGLRRALVGDLDAIILKALRKEPQRRYLSAGDLAADLKRHLTHRPIRARRASRLDRLRKLTRRNPLAATLGVTLVVLVVALGVQALRLRAALAGAERSGVRAAAAQHHSEVVLGFLETLIEEADPVVGSGGVPGLDDFLESGARRARDRFQDRPAVQARLLDTFGMALRHRGRLEEARQHLESSLTLREAAHGPDHPTVADSLDSLGQLHFGTGEFNRAAAKHRRALAIRELHLGADHPQTAESQHNLAEVLHTLEQHDEAEMLYLRALAIRQRHFGPEHAKVAESLSELAYLRHDQRRYDEAEALHRRALATKRALYGDQHAEVATAIDYLAWTLQYKGERTAAEPLYRQVLAMRRQLLGDDHQAVALSLDTLGRLRFELGDPEEAESLLRAALATWQRLGDEQHPMLGTTLNNLALVLEDHGDFDQASTLLERAVAIYRRTLGHDNSSVAIAETNLGRVLAAAGAVAEAEARLREGLRIRRAVLPADHPDLAKSLGLLGELLARRQDPAAEPMLRESVAVMRTAYNGDDWRVAAARSRLGAGLVEIGRVEEGAPLVVESYQRLRQLRGDDDRATRRAAARHQALPTANAVLSGS